MAGEALALNPTRLVIAALVGLVISYDENAWQRKPVKSRVCGT